MKRWLLLFLAPLFLATCSEGGVSVGKPEVVEPTPVEEAAPPEPTFKGIDFDVPKDWKMVPPENRLRKLQYSIQDRDGSEGPATMTLSHFGFQENPVEDNITRWAGQVASDGPEHTQHTLTAGGLEIHWIDMQGTYTDPWGRSNPDFRVYAAVIDTPGGAYFLKIFGPRNTVSDWRGAFDVLLKSVRPQP